MMPRPGLATVEFGFPSFYTHCLGDRPFLGFRGFLPFVDTLANAVRGAEVYEKTHREPGPAGTARGQDGSVGFIRQDPQSRCRT